MFLTESDSSSIFIYANTRALSNDIAASLEGKLDKSTTVAADVIHIHGNLSKLEKFKFVQIFCERIGVPKLLPRVLVGTNSVELSVDHPHVHHVTILEWPDGVALFDQKRGRVGRKGEPSNVSVVAGIVSFISLQQRNHVQRHTPIQKEDDDTAAQSILGRNTNVRSPSKRR